MLVRDLSMPVILKLFLTAAKKVFLCLGIRNCFILWYCDFLTRWEILHRENWKFPESRFVDLNPANCIKWLDYWSRDLINFNFSEMGLGLVSPPRFVHDFLRKMFLSCILLTDPISLSDCLYFLRYWAICVL